MDVGGCPGQKQWSLHAATGLETEDVKIVVTGSE